MSPLLLLPLLPVLHLLLPLLLPLGLELAEMVPRPLPSEGEGVAPVPHRLLEAPLHQLLPLLLQVEEAPCPPRQTGR